MILGFYCIFCSLVSIISHLSVVFFFGALLAFKFFLQPHQPFCLNKNSFIYLCFWSPNAVWNQTSSKYKAKSNKVIGAEVSTETFVQFEDAILIKSENYSETKQQSITDIEILWYYVHLNLGAAQAKSCLIIFVGNWWMVQFGCRCALHTWLSLKKKSSVHGVDRFSLMYLSWF